MRRVLTTNHQPDDDGQQTNENNVNATTEDAADQSIGDLDILNKSGNKRCFSLGDCERCKERTKHKSPQLEGCDETGRREKFECVILKEEKEIKRFELFQPCNRTVADEEFLMVQMQLLCVLIGLLSVLSMQKQKRATASLFDQRRRIGDAYFWTSSGPVQGTSPPEGGAELAATNNSTDKAPTADMV